MVTQRVVMLPGRTDSIIVLTGRIDHEPYGSVAWLKAATLLDSLLIHSMPSNLIIRRGGVGVGGAGAGRISMALRPMQVAQMSRGWLGLNTQGPFVSVTDSSGTRRFRFFTYQPIISVDPGSPADHAGIEPGGLLVAYNGVDLINHEFNFNDIIVPGKRVSVSVRRDGDVKDYSLVVATVPEDVKRRRLEMDKVSQIELRIPTPMLAGGDGEERPVGRGVVRAQTAGGSGEPVRASGGFGPVAVRAMPFPKTFFISPNGLFGASLSNVNVDLANFLKLKRGVLVNDVPEDTPAARAGLRIGDVIIAADDDSVTSIGELRDLVMHRLANRSTDLQVVRQNKVRKVTISWAETP
jgi:S1-C subfamily serine protease